MPENLQNLERRIDITPAIDKRHTGNGIGGARMYFALIGLEGAVVFTVRTGWYLKETTEWKEICIEKSGGDFSSWMGEAHSIGYCSAAPLEEEHKKDAYENCEWIGGTCYGQLEYSLAKEPWDLLVRKGMKAMWEWLENYYRTIFKPNDLTVNT